MVSPAVSRTLRLMAGIPDEDQPDFSGPRPFDPTSMPDSQPAMEGSAAIYDARDADSGPREATPGSVGAQPLPQTPNPMTYGPIQQGDVAEGPPTLGDVTYQSGGAPTGNGQYIEMPVRPLEAQQPAQDEQASAAPSGSMTDHLGNVLLPVLDAAGNVVSYVQQQARNIGRQIAPRGNPVANVAQGLTPGGQTYGQAVAPIMNPRRETNVAPEAFVRDAMDIGTNAPKIPGAVDQKITDIANEARQQFQRAGQAYGEGDMTSALYNGVLGALNVVASPWTVAAEGIDTALPTMRDNSVLSMGDAITNADMIRDARHIANGVAKLIAAGRRVTPEIVAALRNGTAVEDILNSAASAIDRGIERAAPIVQRAGEVAQGVGREVAGGLMDLSPAARVIQESGGGMREIKPTVEVLQEQLNWMRSVIERARAEGDAALEKRAIDRAWQLESELVDARNARLDLEPRIASDVGRRIEDLPLDARSADDFAGLGRERVSPDAAADLTQPSAVATDMRGRMNSAVPGFDPTGAAIGAAAGASDTDEEGNPDPLKTAAGVFVAGLGNSRYGRRFLANAARHAQQGPPPNLWEIMQSFRFSWGMLGNLAQTGLVNVAGGPVELAKGLPTEAIRMSLFHGRPIGTAHYAAEVASGLKDGARGLLATVLGEIPPSVRNAPDFRPPMAERMAGRMGAVGSADVGAMVGEAIDLPGRLASQAPDSLWRPLFLKGGAAKERNTILNEMGVSKLDPAAQWRELQRLTNNPTPAEAQRIADAAKAYADEMGLKGDAGYLEKWAQGIFRPGGRITTSADPAMQQVHEAIGSFAMPFLGAVWKLHKLAATGVPGLGFVANRSLPMDEKISRQLVGGALMYLIADRAAQGLVTGPGPSDPDEAAIVNKKMPPNSTYVPGVGWLSNDTFASAGPYLNAIGAYYDSRRYATEKDKTIPGKGDESTVKYVLRGFERFPVVQAAESIIAMAESPIKGVSDFAANAASSFAPALYRTYQASQDPYARTVDKDAGMDKGILPALGEQTRQKVVSRVGYVPGLGAREDLPPALDRFGRPVENDRQGASAFLPRVRNPKDDALTDIFTRAGIEPGMAPAEIDNIPLTTEQKREWLRVRGEALASKQEILSQNADAPEKRRKDVFDAQMQNAADRARVAVRRLFTQQQREAARQKKAS